MRVISGKAKGRRLKSVPGDSTRPILDRVKESLFSILHEDIPEARWLDLFAGTGQIGIEALSRGATEVVFTDSVRASIKTIHDNLKQTKLTEGAEVRHTDAFAYLDSVAKGYHTKFDLIYVAPPQYLELWIRALKQIDENPAAFIYDTGQIVIQMDPSESQDIALKNLELVDHRKYGKTVLDFYEMILPEESSEEEEEEEEAAE